MSVDTEKIKSFKQLYVATNNILVRFEERGNAAPLDDQAIDQAIRNMDELIEMLPLEVAVLPINLKDAEDEPAETDSDKDVTVLYEKSILLALENWKFLVWNHVLFLFKDLAVKTKYVPLMLAQAERCITYYADGAYWGEWGKANLVRYTNQIGWHASEDEQDPEKLERAFLILLRGYNISNWYHQKYIKYTMVRMLIKLGREDDAYPIVKEALRRNAADEDFQGFKNDEPYLTWIKEVARREEEAKVQLEKAYQHYLLLLKEEKLKIKDQFVYPDHPLVKQHADILNLIKERMLDIRLKRMYRKSGWVTADHTDQDTFILEKMSIEQIQEFEEKNAIRLPDELKVYMMEIGAGGGGYICYGGEIKIEDTQLEEMRKPFPVTPDKIHPVNHRWGIKAWVYPDSEGWKKTGLFKQKDMKVLFGLPEGTDITNGCMNFANSYGQDELFLIMNGAFEGEVWIDSLQYGAEAGGCFGAASKERLKFLAYVAESLLAKFQGYSNASDEGEWM